MHLRKPTHIIILILGLVISAVSVHAQSWTLWASGLQSGVYPRMTVAPNHDIFYTLLGTGINAGYIWKANTQQDHGQFTAMPQIPRPVTIQNNIVALGCNQWSEPLAGIYRTDINEPWIFRFDVATQQWDTAICNFNANLGCDAFARSKDGIIYAGAKWSYIFKSTDDGRTFEKIDDTHAVQSEYPCYYPTYNGSQYNGAIFTVNVDGTGRVYAGTETAGVIYSDDEGATWHPADFFACMPADSTMKDTMSPMIACAKSGNVGGIGFTKDNQLVWTGANLWTLNWKNAMGFADLDAHTAQEVEGLPDYLIQVGQQVSKIVTTDNGQMFFHSGSANGASQIGIYTSWDGIHWSLFNDGITGQNDGQSQGSLAVDGNKVFMATRDGKVWMYEDTTLISGVNDTHGDDSEVTVFPNPASDYIEVSWPKEAASDEIEIFNIFGQPMLKVSDFDEISRRINIAHLLPGMYWALVTSQDKVVGAKRFLIFE